MENRSYKVTNEPKNINDITPQNFLKQLEEEEIIKDKALKDSPYDNFAQLNLRDDVMDLLLSMPNASCYKVFLFFIRHIDRDNCLQVSYNALAEMLNLSRTSVATAISYLLKNNILNSVKTGNSSIYYFNAQIAWKSWGSNVKYAKFNTEVIITKSEQPKPKISDKKIPTVVIK